ncbi:ABC transporter permease [Bacillus altitudinis MN12]|uniref:Permease of ABC guanosine transporter n=3 Tax=Bacillus TaxID=1386 RepID=A0A5K1N7S0_BACAB|nr:MULTISPECIES: ABC transporter permease [Bacillus]AHL72672.1 sugar ABC transporter permease [Bacillus pumilus]KML02401.1 sugar ABC transporter permease [Bacillus stratosphericus]KQL43199.1 sugar ABC transporter permease [Bacillus sp. FJAT-21955]MBR0583907.1 ABC transporter permease [Bacillus altitudinis MN12]MBR0594041.1 ABC transporter permease [Bacillus altitudinis C16B11]MBR0626953.1 ABC transporter permease [Bacillus altitudinis S70-5-12]MBR0632049.1 ABC transporter permease [Bacillus 
MGFLQILEIIVPATLVYAAPLILTALGGVFSERSGVVNIGLEGLMVVGAFSSIIFNLMFADTFGALTPWLGLLVGMAIGGVFSLIHAVATITFRADQTVSGVAINMLALGATLFVVKLIYGKAQTDKITEPFYKGDIPLLSDIPIIGDIFFKDVYYTSILALVLAVVAWFVLFKMPFGLRLRAVGEHPMAADTMGIKVYRMRYIGVFISGLFGGLGGAVYASTIALDFSHATITGQGFIALAALVFGKWHPFGAMGAALFFGFAQSLSIIGSLLPLFQDIPNVYMLIAPYVLTILALTGFIGRADAPKALGTPYLKGKR